MSKTFYDRKSLTKSYRKEVKQQRVLRKSSRGKLWISNLETNFKD